ncbi:sodium/bile acid cotransporter 7 [Tribolium castaneum]|uniref:Sodium/bile acid cotransporter 7-like Protein n=1 Tax=Tribolium castaneum TaxID=7070 RepID=D6WUI1_TRICA|nr:PREDICTED: sodium/bile acid cotransporter 7 [Tribolium castaneum]EFA08480.1 Sodium/bile acid cotransporter 7-like Protein [Tribolium castaneum]|eukprot:XP_971979.1 PREDICTED: sodium/bile acid cotransporter 7 [Tribolium castaneum]
MKPRITVYDYLRKHWLLVGILTCIFFAGIYPELGSKNGPLHTEYSVKYGAVTVIFLISGISLKTESIYETFQQHNLHFFIQGFTFIFIPIFTQIFVHLLNYFGVNQWVLRGLVTVACMPPPVSSAVILTRAADGNETAAIFNSVLGSFLGVVITPLLLLINLGFTTLVPLLATIIQLVTTVLIPLFLGQIIRNFTGFRGHTLPLNTIGQCALLFVIYTTFCDTFETPEHHLSAADVLASVFSVLLMQIILLGLSHAIAQCFQKHFTIQDVITIIFCSTHKSLTLGIPILRILFHGYSHLSQISLPLLIYHPTQIILGGLIVTQLKDWVQLHRSKRPPV